MKTGTKIIVAIAAVAGIAILWKKFKPTSNNQQPTTNTGESEHTVKGPPMISSVNGNMLRGKIGIIGGYRDITLRRCIDPITGKIIYVNGPCPI